MNTMVDIEVVLDESCADPHITIRTKERTEQIDHIIHAIENVSENDFPMIPALLDGQLQFVSQRDIIRVYTQGRKVMIQTNENIFTVKKTLFALEEVLNAGRFLRISRFEIINLYKVKRFDINLMGTIGVEFEDGTKSWVSRSRVKAVRDMLKA